MNTPAKRDSRFELLRIVAAVMILFNHIVINIDETTVLEGWLGFNYYLTDFFHMGGKFGVNLFLLIGCWFMADSVDRSKNFNRIRKILLETLFYGAVLGVADLFLFYDIKGFDNVILCFKYWYTFAYISMLVIIAFADCFSRLIPIFLSVFAIVFIGVTIYGVICPDSNAIWIFDKALFIGPIYFTYVFLFVRQFKKNMLRLIEKFHPAIFFVAFAILYSLIYVIYLNTRSSWIRAMFSPLCFGAALFLFLFFASLNIGYKKVINDLGSVTYGTYLIQCNNKLDMMQRLKSVFTQFAATRYYLLMCVLHIISVFVIAIILNKILKKLGSGYEYIGEKRQ
jgi:hypothetical protein